MKNLSQTKKNVKVEIRNRVTITTKYGPADLITFHNLDSGQEHIAIGLGNYKACKVTNVRIHSECMTGEILGSSKCDCGEQLDEAMTKFSKTNGIVLYLKQEGRGIGLYNKIDAYCLQNLGYDTVEANLLLNFKDDLRDYGVAVKMLNCLNVKNVALLTNNSKKVESLLNSGIQVEERVPTTIYLKKENENYLRTKAKKSGHMINFDRKLGMV